MAVTGMDNVMRNLNKAIEGIEGRTLVGVTKAALLIQRRAMQRVPVDKGNLRASAYTIVSKGGKVADGESPEFKGDDWMKLSNEHSAHVRARQGVLRAERENPVAEPGFSAKYALFVHENMNAGKKEGGPKFLQRAMQLSMADALRIIREHAKVPE